MTQAAHSAKQTRHLSIRLAAITAALLCLLTAAHASASFEQVGCFAGIEGTPQAACGSVSEEKFSEEVQLGGVGGMAVNISGAGGVPAGTLYAAGNNNFNGGLWIAMYEPKADGGLKFVERWQVLTVEGPYNRCGPLLGEEGGKAKEPCSPRATGRGNVDLDVDQKTGNIYVLNGEIGDPNAGTPTISVYSPDGGEVISRFGERAPLGKTTAETPDQIHGSNHPGGIAVNEAGEVYIFDSNVNYYRLMKFKPKVAGQYDEYEYAGTSEDVAAGFAGEVNEPAFPVLDAAGNVYVVGGEFHLEKYDLAKSKKSAVCRFDYPKGGITALTVNPETGEPFFYSEKAPKRIHQLGPCNEATGKFGEPGKEEIGQLQAKPEREDISALALDPKRKFSPTRAAGMLYAGAPGPTISELTQSSLGYLFALVEENQPTVGAESVSKVGTTGVQLQAEIDPEGNSSNYTFQYITETAYEEVGETFVGALEAPSGGALAGEGQDPIAVAVSVSGLLPDTEYRYRVVATSHCSEKEPGKVCEGFGAAQSFRTFPIEAPGLPDNRAWELVSPVQKNGGQVFPGDPEISSCGPEASCKPGRNGARFPLQSSPDGEAVAYEGTPFSPSEGAISENQYISRRNAQTGWQTTNPTPLLLASIDGNGYKSFDSALTQGVLEQKNVSTLSPTAPPGYTSIYSQPTGDPLAIRSLLQIEPPNRPGTGSGSFALNYVGASADLSRVFFAANDALTEEVPGIAPAPEGSAAKFNLYEWSRATDQLALVNVMPGNTVTESGAAFGAGNAHSISADGSRAFWSNEAGQLYVREDGQLTKAIPDPGKFLSAAVDGSKVLLANGHLYDLETAATTDLTAGKGGFQGITGQSDDLSHVYFVDTEVLSGEEENSEGDKAQATKFNLYAWNEGSARFVATLVGGDTGVNVKGGSSNWNASPSARTAEASPRGRFLAFLSKALLTSYDNTGPCETNRAGGFVSAPCPEAFLYDSATGKLICASCNPSGERPLGWSVLRRNYGTGGGAPYLPQPYYLTDQGRLVFDSRDSLSLFDTNEGVEDVYQYEPQGVGSCKRESGCVSLLSAGHEAIDSNFLAMDETGKSVFFTSRDQLVLKDKDDLIDLYVAREGGGIPGETEVARSECQGEACVPALSPPNDPTPGSSSFEGAGNVDERKAAKKHKKKHAKKKHAKKHAHKRAAKHNRGGAK